MPKKDRLAAVNDPRLPLLVIEPAQQPPDRDPYSVYLRQLTGETLRTMRGCLDRLARLLAGVRLDEPPAEDLEHGVPLVTGAWVPWWELRYEGTAALRALMLETGWSPTHINKHLSALRRVLKECWRLGLMDAEDYHRAIDLGPVKGNREPAGRDIGETELSALLMVCDDSPLGIRDGAVIAVVYATGLRRTEAAALTLSSYSAATRSLRLVGKGEQGADRARLRGCAALAGGMAAASRRPTWATVLPPAQGREGRAPLYELPDDRRPPSSDAGSKRGSRCQ